MGYCPFLVLCCNRELWPSVVTGKKKSVATEIFSSGSQQQAEACLHSHAHDRHQRASDRSIPRTAARTKDALRTRQHARQTHCAHDNVRDRTPLAGVRRQTSSLSRPEVLIAIARQHTRHDLGAQGGRARTAGRAPAVGPAHDSSACSTERGHVPT